MDYSGFHVGIVIANNDPNFGGRVKVFVPEHAPNLDKLNKWIDEGKEIRFNAIDKDFSPELLDILEELRECLPWADYAGPIFGGSSNGRFRRCLEITTKNDTESLGDGDAQNGYRPLNSYVEDSVWDDFTAGDTRTSFINPYSSDYEPVNYSGMPRGIFSIPNVGAQVFVFYLNNDPMYPVYFASSYNPDAIKQIYTQSDRIDVVKEVFSAFDYPGDFENNIIQTDDSKVFRSKTVLNSNKHSIEFIDTDDRETLTIQHYGGGFIGFTNHTNILFAPKHDQKLVKGDSFDTTIGKKGISVGSDLNFKIGGNSIRQVGTYRELKKILSDEIKPKFAELANIARHFNVMRINFDVAPHDVASDQEQDGNYEKCPTCGGIIYDPYKNINGLNPGGTNYTDGRDVRESAELQVEVGVNQYSRTKQFNDFVGIEYGWSKTPKIKDYCTMEKEDLEPMYKKEPHPNQGKLGYIGGIKCPTCNNEYWRENPSTSEWTYGVTTPPEPGRSPSTERGQWKVDETKMLYDTTLMDVASATKDSFAKIGDQGEVIDEISMSKTEVIGAVFNDFPSFRVDPIGKLRLDGLCVTEQSTIPYYLPTPHVEPVDIPQLPGGDYTLTIGNKWNVTVGSNGIVIQTKGRMELSSSMAEIAAHELILSSKEDMVIDGGERVMLRARKISVNPIEHNPFVVDGQLHVTRNEIVRGGLFVEGEVGLMHITAPSEIAMTNPETYMWDGEACEINAGIRLELKPDLVENYKSIDSDWKDGKTYSSDDPVDQMVEEYEKSRETQQNSTEYGNVITSGADRISRLIGVLNNGCDAILSMPQHTHSFIQIPTEFMDYPNGVRQRMIGGAGAGGSTSSVGVNNINSRQTAIAADRVHHIGVLKVDPLVREIYNEYKNDIDRAVWVAICKDVSEIKQICSRAGMPGGENKPGSASCFAVPNDGFSDETGKTMVMFFYTVRDFFSQTADPEIEELISGDEIKMANFVARVKFNVEYKEADLTQNDNLDLSKVKIDNLEVKMTTHNMYCSRNNEYNKGQLDIWKNAMES